MSSFLLAACGDWKVDSSELTARTSSSPIGASSTEGAAPIADNAPGLNCASCHGYPLNDTNHVFHLFTANGNRDLNGKITCLDCHSQSIRSQSVTLFDTVYQESDGEKWMTLEHPNPGDKTLSGSVIRSLPLLEVDTLHQHHPIPMPLRAGAEPKFQEYLTGLAHMNNNVDVVFDSTNSSPSRFKGQSALYNPTNETCSALACHPGDGPYRWAAPSKGFTVLKGD